MINQKQRLEAEKSVNRYLKDEWLIVGQKESPENVDFFFKNAETSLRTAGMLLDVSSDNKKRQAIGTMPDFESYLWVIVASYYSMFYLSLALLAKNSIKVKNRHHEVVENTLIARFLVNDRLARLLEEYQDTKDTAFKIVGSQEKAEMIVEDLGKERRKRNELQYETGVTARRNLAETSLKRASVFFSEIRPLLNL